jgi:hypothetical protein
VLSNAVNLVGLIDRNFNIFSNILTSSYWAVLDLGGKTLEVESEISTG